MRLRRWLWIVGLSVVFLSKLMASNVMAVFGEELSTNEFIEVDVTSLTQEELVQLVNTEIKRQSQQVIRATYENEVFEVSRQALGMTSDQEVNDVVTEIRRYREEVELINEMSQLKRPVIYHLQLSYHYDEEKIEKWIKEVRRKIEVKTVEPSLVMKQYGTFELTPKSDGLKIKLIQFRNDLDQALQAGAEKTAFSIQTYVASAQRDEKLLKTIDTKISSFSTYFSLRNENRATNVKVATQRISGTLLMPGDEFSYAASVGPITAISGYKDAPILLNGKPATGVGGGVCQVSSTMYNAQLQAGIVAKERQNHSRIVEYVPRGQDATIAGDYIDYRFVNTLDYPIYINAYTSHSIVTVEFWSYAHALNGINYYPNTTYKGVTVDGKRIYETTLYGYNSKKEIVFQKYLHKSIYY